MESLAENSMNKLKGWMDEVMPIVSWIASRPYFIYDLYTLSSVELNDYVVFSCENRRII